MRIAGPPSFIALIGVFWIAPAAGAPVRTPPTVDYVYVEANEGTASGGHAALKFDRTVYQFQPLLDERMSLQGGQEGWVFL